MSNVTTHLAQHGWNKRKPETQTHSKWEEDPQNTYITVFSIQHYISIVHRCRNLRNQYAMVLTWNCTHLWIRPIIEHHHEFHSHFTSSIHFSSCIDKSLTRAQTKRSGDVASWLTKHGQEKSRPRTLSCVCFWLPLSLTTTYKKSGDYFRRWGAAMQQNKHTWVTNH